MTSIGEQRRSALAARRRLSPALRQRLSVHATRRLSRLACVRRARHVGIYWPLASEIDPRPLLDHLMPGTRCYFPRVEGNRLRFVAAPRFSADRQWRRSALGVREPRGPGHDVSRLDLLVMPLAGFDRRAHRIGLGGGFYDRTLAPVRGLAYRSPQRVGLAFEVQHVGIVEPRDWDVPLQAVVTEAAIYRPALPEHDL